MATFLLKTEPSEFSFDDLVRDKRCTWDGVSNAQALINLRAISKGDEALIYHTGSDKAVVGLAAVTRGAYPDPGQDDPKLVVIDLKPGKRAATPVTLAAIKADKRFADFALVKQSRLSVMPVPPELDRLIRAMAGL